LDKWAAAWDIEGMKRDRRDARRSAPQAGLGLLLFVLGVAAGLSAACRGPQASEGVGGQSGDEGRRMQPAWLGTGGVAAVPSRP